MSRNDGHLKMPANRAKPLLLVDVDGVISLFGFTPDERPAGSFLTVDGILHYLSAAAGEHLRRLSARYELVWCTGWEEKADEHLPHLLGLPAGLPFLRFPRGVLVAGDPESCLRGIAIHEEAGVDELQFLMATETVPHEKVMTSIEMFGKHVIPELKKKAAATPAQA